jgi:hypothetical protein
VICAVRCRRTFYGGDTRTDTGWSRWASPADGVRQLRVICASPLSAVKDLFRHTLYVTKLLLASRLNVQSAPKRLGSTAT